MQIPMTNIPDIPPQAPMTEQASSIVRYEPGRINWNRLVDDQYSAEEAGKVKIVHFGTVGGKPAWADGFMLEVSEVPPQLRKLKKYRERAKFDDKPRDFTELVPAITASDPVVRPLARSTEEKTPVPRGIPSITYLSDNRHEFTAQTKYIDYFVITYPGAQFVMQKPTSPLVVRSGGKTVGIIMPFKADNGLILQFRDLLRVDVPPRPPLEPVRITREQIMAFDRDHTLEELKKMAREKGLSPSGTKHEIIRSLLR